MNINNFNKEDFRVEEIIYYHPSEGNVKTGIFIDKKHHYSFEHLVNDMIRDRVEDIRRKEIDRRYTYRSLEERIKNTLFNKLTDGW